MAVMSGLTDKQQALLVVVAFILAPIGIWMGLGFPTDRAAIGLLSSNIISGIILAIKEVFGTAVPQTQPQH